MMCDNYVRTHQPDAANKYQPFFLLFVDLPAPRSAIVGRDDFPVPSDAPYSDEAWPQAAKNRAALITRIDGSIGRLLAQFQTLLACRMTSPSSSAAAKRRENLQIRN